MVGFGPHEVDFVLAPVGISGPSSVVVHEKFLPKGRKKIKSAATPGPAGGGIRLNPAERPSDEFRHRGQILFAYSLLLSFGDRLISKRSGYYYLPAYRSRDGSVAKTGTFQRPERRFAVRRKTSAGPSVGPGGRGRGSEDPVDAAFCELLRFPKISMKSDFNPHLCGPPKTMAAGQVRDSKKIVVELLDLERVCS